jgi:hypothetical protein
MKIKHLIGLLLIISILTSCDSYNNEYFQTIQNSETGHLRGISIGMPIDSIKAKENSKYLRNEMPDYLHYDYIMDMGNSYTVAYDFTSENKLYEIELSAFFDKIEDAGTLYLDFSERFNSNYGSGKMEEDGFMTWKTMNNNYNVEFAMKDDSEAYGFLSLKIRDLDY